jgi:hypothetical protein
VTQKEVQEILAGAVESLAVYKEELSVIVIALDEVGNFYFMTPWGTPETIHILKTMAEVMAMEYTERSVN